MANHELSTKEKQRKYWEEMGWNIDTECSCNNCIGGIGDYCSYAYDLYNYMGDCLRDK